MDKKNEVKLKLSGNVGSFNNTSEIEEEFDKPTEREKRAKKAKYGPKGGTLAAQKKKLEESKYYVRTKRKPKIKITITNNK